MNPYVFAVLTEGMTKEAGPIDWLRRHRPSWVRPSKQETIKLKGQPDWSQAMSKQRESRVRRQAHSSYIKDLIRQGPRAGRTAAG